MPRAHPLVRSDGALILPLSNENFNIAMMAITTDGGQTWEYSDPAPDVGVIQPTLVEFADGHIDAYFRNSDPANRIKRGTSSDGGVTWSSLELTDRLHPGAGIEALLLKNGHVALVYNNKEQSPRDKLAISISDDGGQTWRWDAATRRHARRSFRLSVDHPGRRRHTARDVFVQLEDDQTRAAEPILGAAGRGVVRAMMVSV